MSIMSDLASGGLKGIGEGVSAIGTGITDFVAHIQGKLTPQEQAQLQQIADQATAVQMAAQAKINEIEASNTNIFVAGWRPAVGWACAAAFALNFLLLPIAQWIIQLTGNTVVLFKLDLATMLPVLLGMLGLGAYRTIEKNNGTTGNH